MGKIEALWDIIKEFMDSDNYGQAIINADDVRYL